MFFKKLSPFLDDKTEVTIWKRNVWWRRNKYFIQSRNCMGSQNNEGSFTFKLEGFPYVNEQYTLTLRRGEEKPNPLPEDFGEQLVTAVYRGAADAVKGIVSLPLNFAADVTSRAMSEIGTVVIRESIEHTPKLVPKLPSVADVVTLPIVAAGGVFNYVIGGLVERLE
jgi:hypothetical protein